MASTWQVECDASCATYPLSITQLLLWRPRGRCEPYLGDKEELMIDVLLWCPRGRCEPYLGDKEELMIDGTPATRTTFGEYVRRLLTDQVSQSVVHDP